MKKIRIGGYWCLMVLLGVGWASESRDEVCARDWQAQKAAFKVGNQEINHYRDNLPEGVNAAAKHLERFQKDDDPLHMARAGYLLADSTTAALITGEPRQVLATQFFRLPLSKRSQEDAVTDLRIRVERADSLYTEPWVGLRTNMTAFASMTPDSRAGVRVFVATALPFLPQIEAVFPLIKAAEDREPLFPMGRPQRVNTKVVIDGKVTWVPRELTDKEKAEDAARLAAQNAWREEVRLNGGTRWIRSEGRGLNRRMQENLAIAIWMAWHQCTPEEHQELADLLRACDVSPAIQERTLRLIDMDGERWPKFNPFDPIHDAKAAPPGSVRP